MKCILLDVSSVSPPSFQISLLLFFPLPSASAFHKILSASCWVTSPWEADTMAAIILSTPSEPCFPRDSPGPVGMKPMLFIRPAGPCRDGACWLQSPSHAGVSFLACSQPKCSCLQRPLLIPVHLVLSFSAVPSSSGAFCLHLFAYSLSLCMSETLCAISLVPITWYITCNQDISAEEVDK